MEKSPGQVHKAWLGDFSYILYIMSKRLDIWIETSWLEQIPEIGENSPMEQEQEASWLGQIPEIGENPPMEQEQEASWLE